MAVDMEVEPPRPRPRAAVIILEGTYFHTPVSDGGPEIGWSIGIWDDKLNHVTIGVDNINSLRALREALDAAFRAALDDERETDTQTYPPPTADELDALRQEFAVEIPS